MNSHAAMDFPFLGHATCAAINYNPIPFLRSLTLDPAAAGSGQAIATTHRLWCLSAIFFCDQQLAKSTYDEYRCSITHDIYSLVCPNDLIHHPKM